MDTPSWQNPGAHSRHVDDTAVVEGPTLRGRSAFRPHLSVRGGRQGIHEWVLRLDGAGAAGRAICIGVATPAVDRKTVLGGGGPGWCWDVADGERVHNGNRQASRPLPLKQLLRFCPQYRPTDAMVDGGATHCILDDR